jgi:quercetin dioxygenase-like cupin family protein
MGEMKMQMHNFPFGVIDWQTIGQEEHKGETGFALWKTCNFGEIRVRMVEYSAGYRADHWCKKGHILLILDGELTTETKDGKVTVLKTGMSYQVADDVMPHRSHTDTGAKLFIVD